MRFATLTRQPHCSMSGHLVPSNGSNAPVERDRASLAQQSPSAWPEPSPRAFAADSSSGIPWRRYVDAVRRHRWLVLGLVFAGIGAGWVATRFVKPTYEVHTTIWIPAVDRADNSGPISGGRVLDAAGWSDLLTSFAVLDKVSTKMGLLVSTKDTARQAAFAGFQPSETLVPGKYELRLAGNRYTLTPEKGAAESGVVGDSIGRKFGFAWAPPARALGNSGTIEFAVATPRQASAALRQRLTVQLTDSNFIIAKLRGTQPARDAAILNEIGSELVATATDLKRNTNTEMLRTLDAQLSDAASALKTAENKLAGFRTSAITQPSEQSIADAMRDPTATAYFTSTFARDSLKADREALERVLADARRGPIDVGALLSIPSARTAPELVAAIGELNKADSSYQALRRQFTDNYQPVKDVQAQITRLRTQTIPQLAAGILNRMSTAQMQFATRAMEAQRKLQAIPARALEEARLRRDVQTKENLYTTLKERVDNSRMAQQSTIAGARVLDQASAATLPVGNTRPYILAMSVLLALGFGVGAALVLDRFDPKLRYPEQVSELGLNLLAAVPHMNGSAEIDHSAEEAAQAVEAFRSLRLNLRHQQPGAGPVQLTVTSPGASEGKSLLAANLALSFAEAGYRTLLIDGDIRRGRQHETFGASNEPGLVDFLAGNARADEIARRSTHPNLLVIPSGSRIGCSCPTRCRGSCPRSGRCSTRSSSTARRSAREPTRSRWAPRRAT